MELIGSSNKKDKYHQKGKGIVSNDDFNPNKGRELDKKRSN